MLHISSNVYSLLASLTWLVTTCLIPKGKGKLPASRLRFILASETVSCLMTFVEDKLIVLFTNFHLSKIFSSFHDPPLDSILIFLKIVILIFGVLSVRLFVCSFCFVFCISSWCLSLLQPDLQHLSPWITLRHIVSLSLKFLKHRN